MKRILSLILVLVLSLSVMVGCDKIPGLDKIDLPFDLPWEDNQDDENNEVVYDVKAAKEFLKQLYQNANPETKRSYDVAAQCLVDGVRYEVTWTVDNDAITIKQSEAAGFWTVVIPEKSDAAINYTLTATIKAGDNTTETLVLNRVVPVINNEGIVTDLKEGVAYKLFFDQNDKTVSQTLFALNKSQNNENKFILATANPKEAPDYFAEKVEGGYKFYTMVDGVKNYVHAKTTTAEGKVSKYIGFATETDSVFSYEAAPNAWFVTVDGTKYVFGTYGSYKTLCISEATYISAENTGISQFPAGFMTSAYAETLTPDEELKFVAPIVDGAVAPVAGTAYNLGMVHGGKDNAVFYLNGTLSGYYMATVSDAASAVNFYVEVVDGGYNLYAIVGGAKLYVNFVVSGTHVNGKYQETAATVFTYDETLKTFKTSVDGTDYIIGTTASKTYTTLGPVKASEPNFYVNFVVSNNEDQEPTEPTGPVEVTIPEAIELADGTEIIVKGTVSEIKTAWSDQYNNISVNIVDADGNVLYLFRLATKVAVGDVITVTGTMATYNGARQVAAGATAVINSSETPDDGGNTPAGPVEVTIPEALKLADDAQIIVKGTVSKVNTAWSDQYNNISVTIVDADGNSLYIFRLATKVNAGDQITVTGKMGTYNDARQVAAGATAVIDVAHTEHTYVDGKCSACGEAEPSADSEVIKCDFSTLPTGTQYADESNTFGQITVSTHNKGCHFNTQLRIYDSDSNNGHAVVTSTNVITSLTVNAGYKKANLEVYGSVDGETWVLIETIATTTTSYADYTVAVDEALGYKYLKLDASGAQIRVASLEVTISK